MCRAASVPDRDHTEVITAGTEAARHILSS